MSIYDKKGSQIAVYHAEFADARSCYGGLCEAGADGRGDRRYSAGGSERG